MVFLLMLAHEQISTSQHASCTAWKGDRDVCWHAQA